MTCQRCIEERRKLLRKLRRTRQYTARQIARLKPKSKAIV